jgi:hypothetical protein
MDGLFAECGMLARPSAVRLQIPPDLESGPIDGQVWAGKPVMCRDAHEMESRSHCGGRTLKASNPVTQDCDA